MTHRYKMLKDAVIKHHPKYIVSHSLGSAETGALLSRNPNLNVKARLYSWPHIGYEHDNRIQSDFKGILDPISVFDMNAKYKGWGHNPV